MSDALHNRTFFYATKDFSMKRTATLLVAMQLSTGSSFASDTMPRYDPESWCEQVANSGGASSEMIRNGCLKQEQSSYDATKEIWSQLPSEMRDWCDQVARSGSAGSYMILNGCVRQEIQSRDENKSTKFKF
jgi:hypothetical protein